MHLSRWWRRPNWKDEENNSKPLKVSDRQKEVEKDLIRDLTSDLRNENRKERQITDNRSVTADLWANHLSISCPVG